MGNVNGDMYVGGIAGGNLASSNINNCYSQGNITVSGDEAYSYAGGLVGTNDVSAISSSYSTGRVSGADDFIGGFIGINVGTVNDNFWDIQSSGQPTSGAGTGLNTTEMQDANTYIDGNWDFMGETANGTDNYWGINKNANNGYPFLYWQGYAHIPTGINNLALKGELKLYPNPANTFIQVKAEKYEAGKLKILDVAGNTCSTHTFTRENKIDISNLPQGLYFVEIETGKLTEVLRFIKE